MTEHPEGHEEQVVVLVSTGGVTRAQEFDAVFERERSRLFTVAFGVLRDRHEAEDAVQETMVLAWRSWDSLRDPDARGAWLTRICLNWCFRRRPRLSRFVPVGGVGDQGRLGTDGDGVTGGAGSAEVVMGPWLSHGRNVPRDVDLDRAFRALPVRQRAAVLLHYHFGYTIEQCGALMGCSPGTVRTHVQRALASLRREVGDG